MASVEEKRSLKRSDSVSVEGKEKRKKAFDIGLLGLEVTKEPKIRYNWSRSVRSLNLGRRKRETGNGLLSLGQRKRESKKGLLGLGQRKTETKSKAKQKGKKKRKDKKKKPSRSFLHSLANYRSRKL